MPHNLCSLYIHTTIQWHVNIICMKFYISMVADIHATPETQLLRTHNYSLQYFIVLFVLLGNLCLSKLVVFLDQLTVFRLPRSTAAMGAKVCFQGTSVCDLDWLQYSIGHCLPLATLLHQVPVMSDQKSFNNPADEPTSKQNSPDPK